MEQGLEWVPAQLVGQGLGALGHHCPLLQRVQHVVLELIVLVLVFPIPTAPLVFQGRIQQGLGIPLPAPIVQLGYTHLATGSLIVLAAALVCTEEVLVHWL